MEVEPTTRTLPSVVPKLRPNRVNLSDVAQAAGVSVASASKVLNGRIGVAPRTRQLVEEAAEQLGYVAVSERERPVRTVREPLIEVVTTSLNSPYAVQLLDGLMRGAAPHGGSITVRALDTVLDDNPIEWAQRLARTGRIGVIETVSQFSQERADALRRVGLPLVLVDPLDVPPQSYLSVGATNFAGGKAATEHLLNLGHTRIAFIGGSGGSECNLARQHGYLAALSQRNLIPADGHMTFGDFSFEEGLRSATALLTSAVPPTAVFASSDLVALGTIEAARTLGLRVPEDLSVVGFDDTFLAQTSSPRLTSVNQPIAEIGTTAVDTIVRLARGEAPRANRVELATHLVLRDSTCPPKARESS